MIKGANKKMLLIPLLWAVSPWIWFGLIAGHFLEFSNGFFMVVVCFSCFLPTILLFVLGVPGSLFGAVIASSVGNLAAGWLLIRYRNKVIQVLKRVNLAFFTEAPPNQSTDPTLYSVTPPAEQESRPR
jgi:hypothetical protein